MEAKEAFDKKIADNNAKIESLNKKVLELQNDNKTLERMKKDFD
jgi:hypothetical protein